MRRLTKQSHFISKVFVIANAEFNNHINKSKKGLPVELKMSKSGDGNKGKTLTMCLYSYRNISRSINFVILGANESFSSQKCTDEAPSEDNIRVVCRFRPLNDSEERAGSKFVVKFPQGADEQCVSIGVSFH